MYKKEIQLPLWAKTAKKTDSNGISESNAKRFFFSEKGFKKAPNGKQLCNRTFEKSFATAQRLLLLQEFMFRGQNVLDIIVDIIALLCSAPNYTDIQQ